MDVGTKVWWRRELRRRDLRVADSTSATIRDALRAFVDGQDGLVVTYRSLPGEVDLDLLADEAPDRYALTRMPEEGELSLHPASSPTERHRYGFDQPTADAPEVADDDVAVVLVPGLAFDRHGGRLGRGLGHYDRLLARLGPATTRVGVTTESSVIEAVPVEPHDVVMTHLATELGVVDLRSTRP